jgi:predicted ATPase
MIKRVYVNNFRTLVNFELELGPLLLLLGPMGAGKSSVFDVLHRLRRFIVEGAPTKDLFPLSDFTRWQRHTAPEQKFEIDMEDTGGVYKYKLTIEHDRNRALSRMKSESLHFDDKPLFEFSSSTGLARLYHDSHKQGPEVSFDWSRSGIGSLMERPDNTKVTRFKNKIAATYIIRPNPLRIGSESREEEEHPTMDLSNFASWYRHLSQESQGSIVDLTKDLRDIMDGFHSFRLGAAGEAKILSVGFTIRDDVDYFKLHELSDGQRMLIALYTVLHCTSAENSTLCVDEAENFLSLPEIQPWLDKAAERAENSGQILLISHHPRCINWLSRDYGIWIFRDSAGDPTRVKRIDGENGSGLPVSQLVERGWIMDEFKDE